MKIARDGWVPIVGLPAFFALVGAVAYAAGSTGWASALWAIGCVGGLFMVYFFRDPERMPPADPDALLSGADGFVRAVEIIRDEKFFKGDAVRVSVFLSPLDVHINRSPASGQVRHLGYTPGRRLLTLDNRASEVNEHSTIFIEGPLGPCLVRQIVGPVVRRVVYWLEPGQEVERGGRIGLMKFGSRLDMYFPAEGTEVTVRKGDRVHAGVSVVARRRSCAS